MDEGEEEQGGLVDDAHVGDGLLHGEGRDGNHGKAAILDLGCLHPLLAVLSLGENPERVEPEVTGPAVVAGLGAHDAVRVDGGGEREAADPVDGGHLAQSPVEERGGAVGGVDDGGKAEGHGDLLVEDLGQGPAGGGEHGEAGVLDLGLAVAHEFLLGLREAEGVEADVGGEGAVEGGRTGEERDGGGHLGQGGGGRFLHGDGGLDGCLGHAKGVDAARR